MGPFKKLILVVVIHCAFVTTVRADTSCEGQNHLDPCTPDSSSSSKVCIKTEQTDSTGTNCELDCVQLCDGGQSVNQECSGEHGPTKTCQNVCDCQDPTSCQLVCKPASKEGKGKSAETAKGKAKGGEKGKGMAQAKGGQKGKGKKGKGKK